MYFIFLFQYITAGARSATWARGQGLTGIPQMASPGCRRWQHKGRTSTNPALNRYGRSRSALYRADMAMGNPAQWSFHVLRAHPGLGSAHLSCRATWMLLDRAPSWRQRRWPQPVNEAQDLSEQRSWDPRTSYVRLGSLADVQRSLPRCLLSGVKRTEINGS